LGRNIKDILGDSDFEQRRQYYEKALGGEKAVFESKFKGEYYLNSISPLYTNGEIETLIMSSQKVTDVKHYQKELDAQKKLIQNIFDNAPLLISVISQEGRYVTVNQEYERLYGIETEAIIGKHYSELLQSTIQQFDEIGANLEKTLKDGKFSYTYDLSSPVTGETISLFAIYTKLYLDAEPAVMIMGMNITAQTEAEKRLKHSYKRLNTQNQMIQDSINYALRIQQGVLDSSIAFLDAYENNFVFSQPKDVLSGDFYWAAELDKDRKLIIAADATGHGVPGAMLTLIGTDYLNEIIYSYHIQKPDILLQEMNRKITDMLTKDGSSNIQDGMDMSVVLIDCSNNLLEFASAKSSIYLVDAANGELTKYKGSRHSIGGKRNKYKKNFTSERIPYKNGDMLYMGSDGFSDQFGGQEIKKIGKRRMQALMKTVAHQDIEEQKSAFQNYFESWKGDQQQIDDVLVLGIRLITPAELVTPKESTLNKSQELRDDD
jgi:PAS domain S-box-containing protein